MKSSTRQVGGVTILDLSGRITLGDGSVALRDLVGDLLSKGDKLMLLNLADVTYVDSSGLGELLRAQAAVRQGGGDLKLLKPGKHVEHTLRITNLCTILDTQYDEAAAVASFST